MPVPIHTIPQFKWVVGIIPTNTDIDLDAPGWITIANLLTAISRPYEERLLHLYGITKAFKRNVREIENSKLADSEYHTIKSNRLTFDLRFIPFLFNEPFITNVNGFNYYGYNDLPSIQEILGYKYLYIFGDDMGNANNLHPDWALAVESVEENIEEDEFGNRILNVKLQSRWATDRVY